MSLEIIATKSGEGVDTHNYQTIFPISGVDYRLDLSYNERMARWVLNITTAAGDPVVSGAPILLHVNLFTYAAPALRPVGSLVATWRQDTDAAPEPTELTLGQGVILTYFERVEDLDPAEVTEAAKL